MLKCLAKFFTVIGRNYVDLIPVVTLNCQASSLELKQEWVRSIRQVIQERRGHLRGALREPIPLPKTPNPTLGRQRSITRRLVPNSWVIGVNYA